MQKRFPYYMTGYKELPDGSYVDPADYDVELKKYEEEIRERNRALETKERKERFVAEQNSANLKAEYDAANKFFISLATLSAASITLLVQHFFLAFSEYGQWSQLALKTTLSLFAISLIFCVAHNFINTRQVFNRSKNEERVVIILSLFAVLSYMLGIGLLVFAVLNHL